VSQMQPEQGTPAGNVPISVDAFMDRLQQRYGKMVAELMQENAELGAGLNATRQALVEAQERTAGQLAVYSDQASQLQSLMAENQRLRETWTRPEDGNGEAADAFQQNPLDS
jgi:hypothetical protein